MEEGKFCNRGFKYIYHISKQGKKYLDYKRKPHLEKLRLEVDKQDPKRPDKMHFMEMAREWVPEELQPFEWDLGRYFETILKKSPSHEGMPARQKRYPPKFDGGTFAALNISIKNIRATRSELEKLQKDHSGLKQFNDGMTELIYNVLSYLMNHASTKLDRELLDHAQQWTSEMKLLLKS